MKNPWLQIPWQEYENHMLEVGQAQILRKLLRDCLKNYTPGSLALIGCATGNGLEEVDPAITGIIHAVDINPDYLEQVRKRYAQNLPGLTTHCLNLEADPLPFSNTGLVFCGLVLEYVKPAVLIPKMIRTLSSDGKLILIIQQTRNTPFVSKTQYRSLEPLSSYAGPVKETELIFLLGDSGASIEKQYNLPLNDGKSLRVFHCSVSPVSC